MSELKRELGLPGAIVTGLGSIVGTGVFVSIAVAAGMIGPAVVPAVALAALVAACNGLSSAQLAANHAVSGGTYEYGYRFLHPIAGFVAGTMFLAAKSASAATAAQGFTGYLLGLFRVADGPIYAVGAIAAVLIVTIVVLGGVRRTGTVNGVIVSVTIGALVVFVVAGLALAAGGAHPVPADGGAMGAGGAAAEPEADAFTPFLVTPAGEAPIVAFLGAIAFLFVAYTGYGRIATLGEEVRDPRRTIPKAVVLTLAVSMLLYAAVAFTGVRLLGSAGLAAAARDGAAPLEEAARVTGAAWLPVVLAVGAVTAMFGVLLNLILGLSRVLLAMGRRRDMPSFFAKINAAGTTPVAAVIAVAVLVAGLTLIGDVRTTWSFSAFTVLVYYALTNLAALFVPKEGRLYPRVFSVAGLIFCLGLAAFIDPPVLLAGLVVLVAAVLVALLLQALRRKSAGT